MEGKTHYERVIGGTEEEKRAALGELQKWFEERSEKLSGYEIEKTDDDLVLINKAESMVNRLMEQYGSTSKDFPIDHIYLLKPNSIAALTNGKIENGIHYPLGLRVAVEKGRSDLLMTSGIVHELLHVKSYKAARVGSAPDDVRLYRSGLSMFDRKDPNARAGEEKEYFGFLEEAIVAECTKKIIQELEMDERFSAEAAAKHQLVSWASEYYRRQELGEEKLSEFKEEIKYISDAEERVREVESFSDDEQKRQAYAAGMFHRLYEEGDVESMERYRERKMLQELIKDLVERSQGTLDHEEAFGLFARANFTGNYLPLARAIERVFGKGSFRALAENFSKEEEKSN